MNITLVISSLDSGGAERVLTLIAEGFCKKGYQVTVITLSGKSRDFYKLPENIHRLALEIQNESPTVVHALWNNLNRLWVLRKAIKSTLPDVVISFMHKTNIRCLLALANTNYPVIVSEHIDPSLMSCGKIWGILRRLTYSYASTIVSVSDGVNNYFDWLPNSKKKVIYNPLVKIESIESEIQIKNWSENANPNKKWLIAMGRLTYQKGFDILISAFKHISSNYPDWQLVILGEGKLRPELENLIENLGLKNQVILPGRLSNPFPVLKQSNIFVLSSRFEGFGNVIIEAMACGLPVISTDCPSGPREIIRDGINGILVPNEDVESLATAMERLMSNEAERKKLAVRAPEVTQRFSLETIMEMWDEVINKAVIQRQSNFRL